MADGASWPPRWHVHSGPWPAPEPSGARRRGDGRLTHELDPHERGPQDACGVFGVWAPGEEVAKLTYFGLYALQHRGQESAGIAVSNGRQILVYKDMGLVAQVFDEATSSRCAATSRSATARYSTTGSSVWENAQPTFRATATGSIALGHNGNLTNTGELARAGRRAASAERGELALHGHAGDGARTSDTDLVTALLASHPDRSLEAAALEVLPQLRGAFSLVFMDETTLYAARDPQGIRPLVLGRLERGWVVAQRDRGAGHRRRLASSARSSPASWSRSTSTACAPQRFAEAEPKGCLFEYVYLARPDTTIAGRSVHAARVEIGRRLAAEAPGRGRPGHPGARVRHPGGDRLRRGQRHPVRPGPGQELLRRPHLHPARRRRSASSASGSSSTRCARSSRASGWSSSTTRSCAATPSARWCGCCARPAPPRCTCASRRRR